MFKNDEKKRKKPNINRRETRVNERKKSKNEEMKQQNHHNGLEMEIIFFCFSCMQNGFSIRD